MKIGPELLNAFFPLGENIRRDAWPVGDHISADGAEGGTIWYYCAEDDELTPDYKLGFHDIGADDWSVVTPIGR